MTDQTPQDDPQNSFSSGPRSVFVWGLLVLVVAGASYVTGIHGNSAAQQDVANFVGGLGGVLGFVMILGSVILMYLESFSMASSAAPVSQPEERSAGGDQQTDAETLTPLLPEPNSLM